MAVRLHRALRHILSPDGSSLTLSSDADLTQRWINVLQFDLADWTWDGLAENGLVIHRTLRRAGQADVVEIAGSIAVPHSLSQTETLRTDARDPAPASSRIVFIDAIDPKPKPVGAAAGDSQFPRELSVTYEISAVLRDAVAAPAPVNNLCAPADHDPGPRRCRTCISAGMACRRTILLPTIRRRTSAIACCGWNSPRCRSIRRTATSCVCWPARPIPC